MICHFLYMKTADAPPLDGYFNLDEVGAKEVPAMIFKRFDVKWYQTPEHTTTTIIHPDGYPRLVITTNVELPEGEILGNNPLKLLRRAN